MKGEPKTATELLIEAMAKKRWRAPRWLHDYAKATGMPLRGRGRPHKAKNCRASDCTAEGNCDIFIAGRGAPGRIWTGVLQVSGPALYPSELRGHFPKSNGKIAGF